MLVGHRPSHEFLLAHLLPEEESYSSFRKGSQKESVLGDDPPREKSQTPQRPDLVPHLQGSLFEKRTFQAVKSASKKIILADNGPRLSIHL